MKYMLLLFSDPSKGPTPGTPEFDEQMGKWFDYTNRLEAAGSMVSGDALQGTETATTVMVRDGQRVVTDGPFIESKEMLGGYYVIDVANLDDAIEWAEQIPNVTWGNVEIRPVMELPAE